MAKYFLGSVGSVEAFQRQENGSYQLAFVSKTLTDSGINTTISKEDIRGGTGAPIQFSFYHDPSVEINLTDVVFKKEYLEAQLGVEFTGKGAHGYATETVVAQDGAGQIPEGAILTLKNQPIPLNFGACGGEVKCVWVSEVGKDEWKMYDFKDNIAGGKGLEVGKSYCVRYCKDDPNAIIAHITSSIIPAEYMLIITAPVFAGDACAASNGKKAGTITYEVPRFRLNGGSEMSFNMSSNQTMSLSGSAYATDNTCEMGEQNLYNIILSLDNYAKNTYKELIVDEDCLKVGKAPVVYGLEPTGRVTKLDNSILKFLKHGEETSALDGKGNFAEAGAVDIKLIIKVKENDQEVDKLIASDEVTVA